MADLDYGRIKDIEVLMQGIKQASSRAEKEYLEKLVNQVINESTAIKSLRKELIGAVKFKDKEKVKRIQMQINHARLEETRGHSWGQLKGERKFHGR